MSVGVGEGILAPAAYSMIADYVEPVTRGRAIYMSSNAIGTGLSLMIGRAVVGANPALSCLCSAISLRGRRPLLVVAPGLITALLMVDVREPARRDDQAGSSAAVNSERASADFWKHILSERRAFARELIS